MYVTKLRGSPTTTTYADFWCPTHERFELEVERTPAGDAPDSVPCPDCGADSIWCISMPMVRVRQWEAVKGKWSKPERPTYTDTRNLGEGQALYDWREDRSKIWEEKRKQDVVAFAREHHERVIGGD